MKLYKATYGIQVKQHSLTGKLTIVIREPEELLISSEDRIDAEWMARAEEKARGKRLVKIQQIPRY